MGTSPGALLQVFAVPLTRKPLFPGTLMPVQVQDQRLINEIIELKRDGWVTLLAGPLAHHALLQG